MGRREKAGFQSVRAGESVEEGTDGAFAVGSRDMESEGRR